MGDTTTIEWTNKTWNPVRGCSRVSAGCVHCYAERIAARFSNRTNYGGGEYLANDSGRKRPGIFDQFAVTTLSGPRWTGKVELIESKLTEPLHWKKPCRVFVNSMSDLFHEALPDEAIDRVFAVMALCPHITFQVLTKRPARMLEWFTPDARRETWEHVRIKCALMRTSMSEEWSWPLPNVWLGVSVEDQATADERIPLLLQTPAAIRFVSYEPALGPVNFDQRPEDNDKPYWFSCFCPAFGQPGIDWIIAGGESGPGARSPHPNWFRNARDQCIGAGVPFFFKQWGEWAPTVETEPDNNRYHEWESGNFSARVGKKKAGALLDGQEWKQFPGTQPRDSVNVERSKPNAKRD
jgi:protein gp37